MKYLIHFRAWTGGYSIEGNIFSDSPINAQQLPRVRELIARQIAAKHGTKPIADEITICNIMEMDA